ncbi:MAG: hypothetical protein AAGA95_18315 [Pseudomonadota bacterium]
MVRLSLSSFFGPGFWPGLCTLFVFPRRQRQRLARATLVACAFIALAGVQAEAAPVSLDCSYPRMADPEGGLRDAEEELRMRFTIDREAETAFVRSGDFVADLELRFSQRHLTVMQNTGNEGLYVTAIVFDAFDESDLYKSVHSRHAMIGGLGELRASQYYGRCEPVFESEGSGGR